MDLTEHFNKSADTWDSDFLPDERKIIELLNLLDLQDGKSILDAGCGTGILIPYLHAMTGDGAKITAVDFSQSMINIAKQKHSYDNVKYIVGDILELDNMNCYDRIICFRSFAHFSDKQRALSVLCGCLCKNGRLAILHPAGRQKINAIHRNIFGCDDHALPEMKNITTWLEACGIKTVELIDNDEFFAVIGIKEQMAKYQQVYKGVNRKYTPFTRTFTS